MKDLIVMLQGTVEDMSANLIVAQLLYPESKNADKSQVVYPPRRQCYIDLLSATQCSSTSPAVHTYVIGQACSMGSFLHKQARQVNVLYCPRVRTMIHRVSSGTRGTGGSIPNPRT